MEDDYIPPPYDQLPELLQQTILRTYYEKSDANPNFACQLGYAKNFIHLTLADLLRSLDSNGHLDVLKAVYERTRVYPVVWQNIHAIQNIWTYEGGGNGISQGFCFTCDAPDVFLATMRDDKAPFCEDDPTTAVHGDRDCFRELIQAGAGLHVCITRPASRGSLANDIHVDKHQVVCTRQDGDAKGQCNYHYFNQNTYDHMKEAVPWVVKEKILPRIAEELEKNAPKWVPMPDHDYGPKY